MSPSSWRDLILCGLVGLGMWLIPAPVSVSAQGWQLLAIFSALIVGILRRPMPMGPLVLLALVVSALTGTLSFEQALSGYGEPVVWLVVGAFLIANSVVKTQLGRRIALSLVSRLGRSTLGLGYSICAAELILGPVVPSNTARGGGILAPIVASLSRALGSTPEQDPDRAGSYLVLLGAHANLITAAMFLTGMAANPLVVTAAANVAGVDFGWSTWALGALVPGLAGLALLPLLMMRLAPPTLDDAGAARQEAQRGLQELGPPSRQEGILAAVFVLLVLLWSTKSWHGLGTGLVTWLGVCVLLLSQVQSWDDVTANSSAWDTLVWLGGLLAMANGLRSLGVIAWVAATAGAAVQGFSPLATALLLAVVYFVSMYGFSMLTAHISAMLAAFLAIAIAAQAPPLLSVALLAYFSNLCACTTNYSTGPVIVYFGLGYVPPARWFRVGALVAAFHLTLWLTLGLGWWRILGWW